MNKAILYLLILISFKGFCQREFSNWYFGREVALNFDNGSLPSPQILSDSEMIAASNCASISDKKGNLLFYTNGEQVWNRQHQIMPNGFGLLGDSGSKQSTVFVPKPGDPNVYYLFTKGALYTDESSNTYEGFSYSEIDVQLDSGNGDITTNGKNILVNPDLLEGVTVVQHKNNLDYWVITHGTENASFYAYLISENGVDTTPITSTIGSSHVSPSFRRVGSIRVSPNGERIAITAPTYGEDSFIEIFDFDTATGIVSGTPIKAEDLYTYNPYIGSPVSIEFSPNSDFIYILSDNINQDMPHSVIRFSTNASNLDGFLDSRKEFNNIIPGREFRASYLQLGIDGSIYISSLKSHLDRIKDPNDNDPLYESNFLSFDEISSVDDQKFPLFGLPQFITDFFFINIEVDGVCFGESTSFSLYTGENVTSVFWDFGDGFTSTDLSPTHQYQFTGTYTVTAEVTTDEDTYIIEEVMFLTVSPNANKIEDFTICNSELFDLDMLSPQILGEESPEYFNVNYYLTEEDADSGNNAINFFSNEAGTVQSVFARVESNADSNCFDISSFTITVIEGFELDLENTYVLCENIPLEVDAGNGFESYLWSTGETSQSILIMEEGEYSVTVSTTINSNTSCSTTFNFTVTASALPSKFDVEVKDLSKNNRITVITEGTGDYEYSIDGIVYQESPVFKNLDGTQYIVSVRDKNGCGRLAKEVFLLKAPNFFTPNNDGYNDYWQIRSAFLEPELTIQIFNRLGNLLVSFTANGRGWDGTYQGKPLPSNDYWYKIYRPRTNSTHTGHFSLKR